MEPDDGALWRRVQLSDAEAFALLFERHANAIYNYCFRRIGDWATAEDLLSLVFLEAWRRRDQALPPDKVLPWLYGIATNVVRNQRRSRRRHAAALGRLPRQRAEHESGGDADERLDDESQMKRVLALVAQLPRREQEVFALCAWHGLGYDDAAAALGIPVGTVRSRLSRARARLRELEPRFGHEEDDRRDRAPEVLEP